MLHKATEKLLHSKNGEERTAAIYDDLIVLRLKTMVRVEFLETNSNLFAAGDATCEFKDEVLI